MGQRRAVRALRWAALPVGVLSIVLLFPFVWFTTRARRWLGKKPRILWGPTALICNVYWSKAVRLRGYKSDTATYSVNRVAGRQEFDHLLSEEFRFTRPLFLLPYVSFAWAVWNYDVFHFSYNVEGYLYHTPARYLEFRVLRWLGKKIVAHPYGSDVQMPSLIRGKHKYSIAPYYEPDEAYVWRNIRHTLRYAEFAMAGGDLVEYLPKFDVAHTGIAIDLERWRPARPVQNEIPLVVHATNHRHLKGTEFLEQACDELKAEGHRIELIVLEQVDSADARPVYEKADIVVDGLIYGTPGMFAVEAMALAKPLLCYVREDLFDFYPHWRTSPIVNTNPDNLKENLRKLLTDPGLRDRLGAQGRSYVEKYHSYAQIGALFDKVYRKTWYGEEPDWDGVPIRVGNGTNPLFDTTRAPKA